MSEKLMRDMEAEINTLRAKLEKVLEDERAKTLAECEAIAWDFYYREPHPASVAEHIADAIAALGKGERK